VGKNAASVLAGFEDASAEELIRARVSSLRLPPDVADVHLGYELLGNERGAERMEQILVFAGLGVDRSGIALDIGCGMGGSTRAMSERFGGIVGIDVSFANLIVARRRCREASLDNVALICATAEALPFADGTFELINATDVVEHVPQQSAFLREGYRVLAAGGCFCFNSPNRYNIFGPEPHVNLWGVGFMPRRWMPAYVRWFKGMGYTGKRLLSYLELRRLLGRTRGMQYRIHGTAIRRSSARRGWKHRLAFRWPWLVAVANRALKPFVPQYEVVVNKARSLP
jgi:ubiquinone/menaquinone biosynthesis C-methylase UbiE